MAASPVGDEQDPFEVPGELPLLPVRDVVVFPNVVVPLFVSRPVSLAAVEAALARDRLVFVTTQKSADEDAPTADGLHATGVVGMVMRMRKLSDGRVKVLVQGLVRARATEIATGQPHLKAKLAELPDAPVDAAPSEVEVLVRAARDELDALAKAGKALAPDVLVVMTGLTEPGRLADLVASNLTLQVPEAQALLECADPLERLRRAAALSRKERALIDVKQKIDDEVREQMTKAQREYFLREQLKQIRTELGETDGRAEELAHLKKDLEAAKLPPEADAEAKRQLARLEHMHQDSAEWAVLRAWLEWVTELPWSRRTEDALDLARARAVLDEDHFGLEKVKERILEHLAVAKLKGKLRGPVLCFVGPPGVGKTSLGRSIAKALGRNFARISLGGVRDEAEIRGHRRAYVGATPGRLVQALKAAKSANPVIVLDELDKLVNDGRGDPAAALLEVLDPEQNGAFVDHYLGVPVDLSGVLFIGTANLADGIPGPLRDRMELIALPGYSEEDKLDIARRHLVPRQLTEAGLTGAQLELSPKTLTALIRGFTREAGLRGLDRQVGAVCRKAARAIAEGKPLAPKITPKALEKLLGPAPFATEALPDEGIVGQATGLAWTPAGGEVLHIEASANPGGAGLILTGQLGEVMRESAQAALSYAKAKRGALGIRDDWFRKNELHLHVPAGAIPKDGPSAGVTLACAIVSLATRVPLRHDVAMTGEITLRGRVLPVGGVREKVLAALRQGITTVVVPEGNLRDLADLPPLARRRLEVVPARSLDDVLKAALVSKRGRAGRR